MALRWFSISATRTSNNKLDISGFFAINSVNFITQFYLTGNFSKNVIAPLGEDGDNFNNLYNPVWKQFDTFGVGIDLGEQIPDLPSEKNKYRLASGDNDKMTTSLGFIGGTGPDRFPVNFIIVQIKDPTCFNFGTKILVLKDSREKYVPVQDLRRGDIVKTYLHGYRKIDCIGRGRMVNDPSSLTSCMYKMTKTDKNGLIEDLYVTGGHSILVNALSNEEKQKQKCISFSETIDDKVLLLAAASNQFVKVQGKKLYTYYHFTCENGGDDNRRFGVYANGILTETPSKNYFVKQSFDFSEGITSKSLMFNSGPGLSKNSMPRIQSTGGNYIKRNSFFSMNGKPF